MENELQLNEPINSSTYADTLAQYHILRCINENFHQDTLVAVEKTEDSITCTDVNGDSIMFYWEWSDVDINNHVIDFYDGELE